MKVSGSSGAVADFDSPLIYLSTHFIQAKEYLEAILASSSDAIVTTDMKGRIQYFSPGAEKLFGKRSHEALGTPVWRLYAGGREEARRIMDLLTDQGTLADLETKAVRANGKRTPISMSAAFLKDRSGALIGTLRISKDISRRVKLENRLRELSITDNLTGLYNQRHFHDRASSEVDRAKRQGSKLSMLVIDLDRFKQANDLWGHQEGDRILRETAELLSASIRRNVDTAFRYGGDEFIILLPAMSERMARNAAARIRAAAAKKSYAGVVGLSIGVATLAGGEDAADVLRRADAEMYKAKRRAHGSRPPDQAPRPKML